MAASAVNCRTMSGVAVPCVAVICRTVTGSTARCAGATGYPGRSSWLRGLRGICSKQAVFQRCAIEAADDGIHLFRVWRFNESESLGLLRFGVADHLNRVRDQILGAEPSSDVVRSHPSGQIAQKDRKTHSGVIFDSIGGGLPPRRPSLKAIPYYHSQQQGQIKNLMQKK